MAAFAVYPRVCGGNQGVIPAACAIRGLSPRVRGKQPGSRQHNLSRRSIPACAGETRCCSRQKLGKRVYPRVCGGNPRPGPAAGKPEGLSPRVRGKPPDPVHKSGHIGSIPACAGETAPTACRRAETKVYPRVCGGNQRLVRLYDLAKGLSPRVRGKLPCASTRTTAPGSIPACAGETEAQHNHRYADEVYPRVCGGNGRKSGQRYYDEGLSPRVRGKRGRRWSPNARSGSIPACAGETPPLYSGKMRSRVYPRVCGGNKYQMRSWIASKGLSPRVRGKHPAAGRGAGWAGSIPACAGETGGDS